MGAEQEHVAPHRLDREILVDRPDQHVARLHQHPVVTGLRDRSTRRETGKARTAPAPQSPVDPVAMEVGHALPPSGLDPGRDKLDDLVEDVVRQLAIRPRADQQCEQLVLVHTLVRPRRDLGHDLLGEDVERLLGRLEGI